MSRRPLSWFAATALAFAACGAAAGELPCKPGEKECAFKALVSHRAKTIAYWSPMFAKPLEQRIGAAPDAVVELIALDNLYNGYPEHPKSARMDPKLKADVIAAFHELPRPVKARLDKRLAGIYFVADLGGTGFTDSIADADGQKHAAFIVLDPRVLERTANAWATWKESSPFVPDPRYRLVARIEPPETNDRRHAIQYILLHELGHVLAVGADYHPDWNLKIADLPKDRHYPFFDLSWTVDTEGNRYLSRFEAELPERGDVRYYFGPKLPASRMAQTYEHLEATNFPTLYAATIPGDDFAESFASYVHVVMMGKPFEITISEDGRVARRFGSCWGEERCAGKKKILDELLR
ncbi:MAG TPA: hypothetical protein VLT89_09945 [Usitatibacter sp.]|nr:hypothetical protein [Usitatibacter sp.]